MKDPATLLQIGAFASGAGALTVANTATIFLFGVPLPMLLAVIAGALFAASLMPVGEAPSMPKTLFQIVMAVALGCYLSAFLIAWIDVVPGEHEHKLFGALSGATTLVLFEGVVNVARRAPYELWASVKSAIERKLGGGGK